MQQKPRYMIGMALVLAGVGLMVNIALAPLARAAPACPSSGSISDRQRKDLQSLPPDLHTILKAVQQQQQTSCGLPSGTTWY